MTQPEQGRRHTAFGTPVGRGSGRPPRVLPRCAGRTLRRIALGAAVVLLAAGAWQAHRAARIGTGLAAKLVCSETFLAGRDAGEVAADLAAYRSAILDRVEVRVDRARQAATATLLGLARREAVHREGLGCALGPAPAAPPLPPPAPARELPAAPTPAALAPVVAAAFAESDPARPARTRAVLIVQDGRIVAERYAPGYSAAHRFPGWSMTKSVAHALVGVLVREGRLVPGDPAPVPGWTDGRRAITLEHLLAMSSGLAFSEDYANPLSDVLVMLFGDRSPARYAAERPLAAPPGTRWAYASGTSNVIAGVMRTAFDGDAAYLAFPRRALFDRLGMASAVMEADAAGLFVASSFMHATARDWAKLGQLYLQDGLWDGERLLPEGWARAAATPVPAAPRAQYAAHWWLALDSAGAATPPLPAGTFHAAGHGGQYVSVVPGRRLVVVRLGLAVDKGAWDQTAFVGRVIEALAAGR